MPTYSNHVVIFFSFEMEIGFVQLGLDLHKDVIQAPPPTTTRTCFSGLLGMKVSLRIRNRLSPKVTTLNPVPYGRENLN